MRRVYLSFSYCFELVKRYVFIYSYVFLGCLSYQCHSDDGVVLKILLQPLLNFRVPVPEDLARYGHSSPNGSASSEGWLPSCLHFDLYFDVFCLRVVLLIVKIHCAT